MIEYFYNQHVLFFKRRFMILSFLFFTIGLLALYFGAEWLVKGSSELADRLGLSPIVIGLTVVAFGTSAPELVVSVVSSFQGRSMIAVGNVIGSNICNIALVLGLSAFLRPISSDPSLVRRDIPIMISISIYLFFISCNSFISRMEGFTLFSGIICYTWINCKIALKHCATQGATNSPECSFEIKINAKAESKFKLIICIITGIIGIVVGAELLVKAAVNIMKFLGVGEKFIGLTIVAFGTSLPELATSVIAAMKGEMDISIGNLIGSNVFNILSVLGVAALVSPINITGGFIDSGLIIDYGIMLVLSILPFFMMKNDATISRVNGMTLLFCYVFYIFYLVKGLIG
ncbi:MAG: calcium/sodium antiporter [Desulfobacula sp.]|nr:calcium/sodium antiporter [Desulfobacula sp.]